MKIISIHKTIYLSKIGGQVHRFVSLSLACGLSQFRTPQGISDCWWIGLKPEVGHSPRDVVVDEAAGDWAGA